MQQLVNTNNGRRFDGKPLFTFPLYVGFYQLCHQQNLFMRIKELMIFPNLMVPCWAQDKWVSVAILSSLHCNQYCLDKYIDYVNLFHCGSLKGLHWLCFNILTALFNLLLTYEVVYIWHINIHRIYQTSVNIFLNYNE